METRAHYVAVGAFVLTMVVLAFATVLWLGRAELATQYANYDIYFVGPGSGLRVRAAGEYSRGPGGRVPEIKLGAANGRPVRDTGEVDSGVAVKPGAAAAAL